MTSLASIATHGSNTPTGDLLTAGSLLRGNPPRFPGAGITVTLPAFDLILTGAIQTTFALDRAVPGPWSLVGGLMVMLHCAEQQVPFSRATGDADLAVGVFTHRTALQ